MNKRHQPSAVGVHVVIKAFQNQEKNILTADIVNVRESIFIGLP